MPPLTKIAATIGPQSQSVEVLEGLLRAGMSVSHSPRLLLTASRSFTLTLASG